MCTSETAQSYKNVPGIFAFFIGLFLLVQPVMAAAPAAGSMKNYCVKPPFVSQSVPPMVMFEVGRDHKLYYEAYNDGVDLNGDGRIDRTYDHSIEYYGYFNPYKCYTPPAGASSGDYFTPVATNTDRFCSAGQWGGNILNWLTMSRMDVLRKVMYGGQRSKETPRILLDRAYIPQDAHSWGKEYTGKLCYNSTAGNYTNMCYADSDCDTGYSCTDKSLNLLGMVKPTGGDVCSGHTITWGTSSTGGEKKLLVVRYPNAAGRSGTSHADIMAAFDTTQFLSGFSPQFVTSFSDSILDPAINHGDKYAQIVVSEFYVAAGEGGTWSFAIDSDDGSEMEILTTPGAVIITPDTTAPAATSPRVAYYGAHSASNGQTFNGTYTLAEKTWYRMIVRQVDNGGEDGVRVWFKKPGGSSWNYYGYRNSNPKLLVRAPDITIGTNDCTLKSANFVLTGTPENTGISSTGQSRHLFCNTTLSSGVPSTDIATSILRMITNSNHRIWEWASKERPVCDDTFTDGSSATSNRTDYTVQVEVCKPGLGTLSMNDRFERCRSYGGTFDPATKSYYGGSYVPVGLFQKYGEVEFDDSGNEIKVCSKTMGKICSTDADCGTSEGLCFTKAPMYFGLMTTSYTKNTSGGVLRKNPGPVFDEVNNNDGKMQTSENERGNLITSINRLKIIDFNYGDHSYSNCGWIVNRPMTEGECKMWGNPLAEMMYESLRYFAGKGTTSGGGQTAEFDYSTTADSGVSLSKPKWGYNKGSVYYKPFEIFPSCSQPFLLLLSDINTSFDSDQIPGSLYPKTDNTYFTEDSATPQLGLGVTTSGKSLLNQLTDFIGEKEGINGHSWFIGESVGTNNDFICTAKAITNLSAARGMCPEEPTKKGSYYAAALAYYGKTQFAAKTGNSAISTFVVAMSSPFADIKVKAGNGFVNVVPVGKSVYGGGVDKCLPTGGGTCSLAELTTADSKKYYNTVCTASDAFCPTNSLVDFYIDDTKYDASNNIIYMKFRINFEDVEQGADHDMDAIASYELCTQAAATAHYGSCTGTIAGLQVKVKSEYAAGGIAQLLGFVISGTTEDGTYLVIKDVDTGSGDISGLPIEWNKTFSVTTSATGNYLKNPLWYAAKWGGFTGSDYPKTLAQWDKNNDGLPDSYFPVSNPLQLDEQLEKALNEILSRIASGTAASILNNSEGSGANLLQAVFYPKKPFDDGTEANWVGEMQNLWYYLDPYLQHTSIREDSDKNNILNIKATATGGDQVAQFFFDTADNQTKVSRFYDSNGDGSADSTTPVDTVNPDYVRSLWKAGRMLWARNLGTDNRVIKTHTGITGVDDSGTGLVELSSLSALTGANATAAETVLQTTATELPQLISYIYGVDFPNATYPGTTYRSRTVTIKSCSNNRSINCSVDADCGSGDTCSNFSSVWKLGDIISSTPKLVSNVHLNNYGLPLPNGYNDASYVKFNETATYKNRGMAFVGGNDGMLHAFKLGILQELTGQNEKARLVTAANPSLTTASNYTTATSSSNLGKEMWAYIPRHALPYLTYLKDNSYCHLYYVDRTPTIIDASVAGTCAAANHWDCPKASDGSTWKTVLIGGMGIGGACRDSSGACATEGCVKTPIAGSGYSSYFALDVTNPESPSHLWEFPNASMSVSDRGSLGYSTTGPAIVRISARVKDSGGADTAVPDASKNGRWLAVFASGPTGPIDTTKQEFQGKSDQNLKVFIVDIKTGELLRTIDTGVAKAFAGTLSTSWIDTDRTNQASNGYYSDDVVYIGYTKKAADGTWTEGGVLRLQTKEDPNPANWALSTLISGTGPITTSVTKLQDRKNKLLWVYFGTGRYFYKQDDPSTTVQQKLYGVKEPCYSTADRGGRFPVTVLNVAGGSYNDMDPNCTDSVPSGLVNQSGDASTAPADSLAATASGWYIALDAAATSSLSERMITDPLASTAGAVFFTTFKPSSDVCQFGGQSLIWAVNYATGGVPPAKSMQGKALMQVSTGAFAEISLTDAFDNPTNKRHHKRRIAVPIAGVPPTAQGLSLIVNPPPLKKFLHVREK